MKEITLDTKISELLNDYEGMKDILISINPKFKKLNNPILRKTIAKVASVKQAAFVGGMEPAELLNKLREAVGQEKIEVKEDENEIQKPVEKPSWIVETTPKVVLNANKLLDEDKNPLAEVSKALKSLEKGDVLEIVSDFRPEPLIDEFVKKGYEIFCDEINDSEFKTYIKVS